MPAKRARIKARLEEALELILCPVSGCWSLHGGPHRRHRVEWTTPDEPTVWLAVHYGRPER